MTSTVVGRGKRVRGKQRAAHIVLGLLLVGSVYVPVDPGSLAHAAVQWFVAPGAVIAGMVMWQWPRIRRFVRRGRPSAVGVGENVA
jgi:hypothetical protein